MRNTGQHTNWAGNVTFRAARMLRPSTVSELQDHVGGGSRVRPLGTGHSFNRIADTTGDLISVAGLPRIMEIDSGHSCVTVSAGIRYAELASYLNSAGWALQNLASLPHISIAGSCATGTHGSGDANGSLATAVSGMEMVTADGSVSVLSATDGDRFRGSVVGLGALGIVTSLTLDIVPAFDIQQVVYENLPRRQADAHFEAIFSSAYSVSLFTDWRGSRFNQVWLKRRTDAGDGWVPSTRWLDARLAEGPRNPVPGNDPVHCTQQLGVPRSLA